jgi:pyruvate/2-oxoglutarate/acetoin dehydrogenase E1 component
MAVETATRQLLYGQAITEALRQEMRRDPRVLVMGEDIAGGAGRDDQGLGDAWGGPFGLTKGLVGEFGRDRILDTPISEMGFFGAAVGAAGTGKRPVADRMFLEFIGSALDQVMNQGAKLRYMFGGKARVPMTIMTAIGAGLSAASQHSQILYPMFVQIPGLKVVAPSDAYTAKGLMATAIRDDDPVIVCNHKALFAVKGDCPEGEYTLPLGKARITRVGKDVTLVGMSRMTNTCNDAAKLLAKDGIEAEVVDVLSLSPLDEETILSSVGKTRRVVVVDESHPRCSMATDIAALIADKGFDLLDAPIKCVTAPHAPVPFAPILEAAYIPSKERIADTARALFD